MSEVQTIKILLVEDHLLTRIGLKTVIQRQDDLRVVGEAGNGEEAIGKFNELAPNLVLMDVSMPEMDGIAAARKIKANHQDVKIVMLTSHDNDRDIFASLAAGAGGYCMKGAAPERLYSAIRTVSAGDPWLDPAIAGKVIKANAQQSLGKSLLAHELELLGLLAEDLSYEQIAEKLVISVESSKITVSSILNKLSLDDRTQAAVQAMRAAV
jgi:DNA-binding NarL/FixJ family response regulator